MSIFSWYKSSQDVPMCLWPYAIWWLFCLSPSVWWGTYVRRRWMLLCLFVFAGLFLPFLRALLVLNKQWRFLQKLSDYYRFSVIQLKMKWWVCNKKLWCETITHFLHTHHARVWDIYYQLLYFWPNLREQTYFLCSSCKY